MAYRRDAQVGGTKWSTTSRVIGKESDEAIWVVNGGLPVLCSVHSLRPASEEEVMSHCLLNGIPVLPESLTEGPKGKRGFVDARDKTEEPEPKTRKPTPAARKRKQDEVEQATMPSSSSSSSSSTDSSTEDESQRQKTTSQGNSAVEEEVDQNVANIAENYLYDSEEAASAAIEAYDFRPATCLKLLRRGKRSVVNNGHAYSFGAYAHGKFKGVTESSNRHPMLISYLNEYLRARGATGGWSTIQVSKDLETPPHKDCNNLKNSVNQLTTLGRHEGGQLWVKDPNGDRLFNGENGRVLACRNKIASFSPDQVHATLPSEGERWSISAFTSRSVPMLSELEKNKLKELGFDLDELDETIQNFAGEVHQEPIPEEEKTTAEPRMQSDDMLRACASKDHWKVGQNMHFRIHVMPRRYMYEPNLEDFPGDISKIGYTRETHRFFEDGTQDVVNDEWGMIPEASGITNLAWTGFSLFRVRSESPVDLSSLPEIPREDPQFRAFAAERFGPGEESAGKKPRKLNTHKCDDETKEGIKDSRKEEWRGNTNSRRDASEAFERGTSADPKPVDRCGQA